jgi:hypothetical protein
MSNASVANLLLICFDRYFSITRPLTYRAKRTPKRVSLMIAGAWVISCFIWTPVKDIPKAKQAFFLLLSSGYGLGHCLVNDYQQVNVDYHLLQKRQVGKQILKEYKYIFYSSGNSNGSSCFLFTSNINVFTLFSYLSRNGKTPERITSVTSTTS